MSRTDSRIIGINLLWMEPSIGGAYQYAVDFTRQLLTRDRVNQYFVFYDDDSVFREGFEGQNAVTVRVDTTCLRSMRSRLGSIPHLARLVLKPPGGICSNGEGIVGGAHSRIDLLRKVLPKSHSFSTLGALGVLRRAGLDMLIQPVHGWGAFYSGIPYVVSIHDFPSQWSDELRTRLGAEHVMGADLMQRSISLGARAVLVDSTISKRQLNEAYGVPLDRIHVLPFKPPDYLDSAVSDASVDRVRDKYSLPSRFLFYPAGIHPHKNHLTLIEALTVLRREYGLLVPLVLTGFAGPAFETLNKRMNDLGLGEQVLYLGYVEGNEMAALYRSADALVMPTLIGPTNIPVLEAFSMGCPVICSNVEGFAEQIGDAGLLIDPLSTGELADAIYRIWTDQQLRGTLVKRGYQRLKSLQVDDFGESILEIVQRVIGEVSPSSILGHS